MENVKLKPKEIYEEYEKANEYKNSIGERGIYEQSKMNERFFVGDQWHGVQAGNSRPLVRRNIIKRIGEYKISSICANPVSVNYTAEGIPENEEEKSNRHKAMELLNGYFLTTKERINFDLLTVDAVREAYISGTSFIYTYWDETVETGLFADKNGTSPIMGDIKAKLISVVNVILGDPNNPDIQSQPYIIIAQRMTKGEALRQAKNNSLLISPQKGLNPGDRGETEPEDNQRVTVLTKFFKEYNGGTPSVKAIRVTEESVIKDVWDTKLRLYPLAGYKWLPRASSAYGDSEITYLIPNQIAINRALSAAVWSTMITGMPKIIVNRDLVSDGINNDPGQIINLNAGEDYDVNKAISYVSPPQFAAQLHTVVNDVAEKTLSDAGANEAALGDIRPENATAIIATREAAMLPMQVYKNTYYQFIEEIARIWADFWVNMYGTRPLKVKAENETLYKSFDGESLKRLVINAKVDVGASTIWGEAVVVTSLSNLLEKGIITTKEYLERLPKGIIPDITGLIKSVEEREMTIDDSFKVN